jgi:hypothetical protein
MKRHQSPWKKQNRQCKSKISENDNGLPNTHPHFQMFYSVEKLDKRDLKLRDTNHRKA